MTKRTKDGGGKVHASDETTGQSVTRQVIADNETLRRMYTLLLKCRMAEERVAELRRGGTAQIAATIELSAEDAIASPHRTLEIELTRGVPMATAIASACGVPTNGTGAEENTARPRLIPAEGAASSQLSVACGVALACQLKNNKGLVMALTQAHLLALGSAHEAMDYAATHRLPLVIVADASENVRPTQTLTAMAQGHGIAVIGVDGNDAVAVYRVAREAIHRARAGRGPTLIECQAFPETANPTPHLEAYLEKHGLWTQGWKRSLVNQFRAEVEAAVKPSRPTKKS